VALPACRDQRRRDHPRTPDKYEVMSKRAWDGRVKSWRKALHKWTPSESQATEELGDDANLEEIDAMLGELEDDNAAFGAEEDGVDAYGDGGGGGGGGGGGLEGDMDAEEEEEVEGRDSFRYFDDELDETNLLEEDPV
jgi:hypothetical protein